MLWSYEDHGYQYSFLCFCGPKCAYFMLLTDFIDLHIFTSTSVFIHSSFGICSICIFQGLICAFTTLINEAPVCHYIRTHHIRGHSIDNNNNKRLISNPVSLFNIFNMNPNKNIFLMLKVSQFHKTMLVSANREPWTRHNLSYALN